MSSHTTCVTEIISQSDSCTITRCKSCKTYHLHIGPLSLRLKEDMFESLSNTILNAQMELLQKVDNNNLKHLSH